jgi:hypothetical protein
MPIGTGVSQAHLEFSLHGLGGSKKAVIRVTASDGFNTGSAVSNPFEISPHPPMVGVISTDVQVWQSEQPVRFRGVAFDLQDGILPGKSLRWFSNLDGDLGTGSELERSLKPGRHVLTLRATNSWGLTSIAQTTVVVVQPLNK